MILYSNFLVTFAKQKNFLMIEQKKFIEDFESLAEALNGRKIDKKFLLEIKEEIEKKNSLIKVVNELREKRKNLSRSDSSTRSKSFSEETKNLKKEIYQKERELDFVENELNEKLSLIPNIPYKDTPSDEHGNLLVNQVVHNISVEHNLMGDEVIKKMSITDEEKSLKLSGSKFAVYKGFGSILLRALINFLISENIAGGYSVFDIPYIVDSANHYNVGQLPKFKEDIYKIENTNFFLIPTSETALVNLYKNQIIDEEDLDIKLCSYSPCFRAEAGSSGQENKGIIRLHQFNKVELVKITKPEKFLENLNEIVKDARNILDKLKLSYRIVDLCMGELGFSARKTYDIEI
jgi:seryl-tRNA synthetase